MATILSNQSVIHFEKRHGIQQESKTAKPTGGLIDQRLLNKHQKDAPTIKQSRNTKSNFSDLRKRTDNLSKQMKTFNSALDELQDNLEDTSEHIEHWQGIFTYSAGREYVTETSEYYADLAREERRRRNRMEVIRKSTAASSRSRGRSSRSTTFTCSTDSDSEDETLKARKITKKVKSKPGQSVADSRTGLKLPRVHSKVSFQHYPKPRPHSSGPVHLDKIRTINNRLTRPTATSANARIITTDGTDIHGYNKVTCPALGYAMSGTMVGSIDKLAPGRFRGMQKLSVKGVDSVVQRLSNVDPGQVPDSNRTICPRVKAIAGPLNSYAWAGTDRDRTSVRFTKNIRTNIYR
ncbi:unnamed protein product [Owenia fusiformis]|uniref:Uncharacterized protein n=1 Tax=Owenia fusiformis TaxID=6347 RepID=A0A8J1TZZ9_OWEFU|nr:unnamed protein product [Owenia fusiformis]